MDVSLFRILIGLEHVMSFGEKYLKEGLFKLLTPRLGMFFGSKMLDTEDIPERSFQKVDFKKNPQTTQKCIEIKSSPNLLLPFILF